MKRTLSLLLALIMVVGLLPNTMAFASATNDDIYIDESSSLEELEDLGIVDYDECDPMPDTPEKVGDPQPDIFVEDPEIPSEYPEDPSKDPETPGEEMPGDFGEYPEESGEEQAEPAEPAGSPEDHPQLSASPELPQDRPGADYPNSRPSADSDDQYRKQTGEGFGSLSGLISADMLQGNATEVKNDLVWTANATGADVCEGLAIDTSGGALSFKDGNSYEIKIVPNTADASAAGATRLHINLYQLQIDSGTTVRVYLDDTFDTCSDITEVVIHTASTKADLIQVNGGSLTLEGRDGCQLVLDGRSLDGTIAYPATTEVQLLQLGTSGVDNVTVSYVTFRNAPRSAVYAYGGLMKSITFTNCQFESTCDNSEDTGTATNRSGGAIRFAPYSSKTNPTFVENLIIDNCEFDGNTAIQYGGAVGLYGVFDQVEIKNSRFTNAGVSKVTGGAVGILGMFNKVDIMNNTFDGCTASGTGTDLIGGGAIGIRAVVGKLTIDSDFSNCSTDMMGGAIYADFRLLTNETLPHLTESVHTRINTLEISGSHFQDCSSGDRGGAVCLDTQIGDVIIGTETAHNTFENCIAADTKSGGGICFGSTEMSAEPNWPAEQWAPAGMTIEAYAGGTPYGDYLTRSGRKYTAYRSVSVKNCTFDGCQSSYGGGFYVPNNAKIQTLEIKNVIAKNGVATSFTTEADGKTTTSGGRGGGIGLASFAPDCSITLNNVQAFRNHSDEKGGGVFINCVDNTSITVIGGQYYNNTANTGGGLYIEAKDRNNVNISFSDSKIYKNTTVSHGGGVYLENSSGSSTFTNIEVYGNFAGAKKDASGSVVEKGTENCYGDGGGLYLTGKNTATVTFIGGVIGARKVSTTNAQGETVVTLERSPNRAFAYTKEVVTPSATPDEPDEISFATGGGGRGGGIGVVGTSKGSAGQQASLQLVMTDTKVCYNQSEYCGGGMYLRVCDAQLNNVSVDDNQCGMVKNGVIIYEFREAFGLLGGGIAVMDRSTIAMNGGEITHNEARTGGGMAIDSGTAATMQNVRVTYNEAHRWAGGVYVMGVTNELTNSLNATGCEFAYNVAGIGESGGNGGGLAVYSGGTINLTDTKFCNNEIRVGYVFTYNTDGTKNYTPAENANENPAYYKDGKDKDGNPVHKEQYGYGAGIYCHSATAELHGVDVNGNVSGRRGGGVYGEYASSISVYHYPVEEGKTDYLNEIVTDQQGKRFIRAQIRNNTARDYAGGIGAVGSVDEGIASQLLLEGTLVENNQVERHGGGGVYISSLSVCTITEGTVIQNNIAQRYGGGIYANIRGVIYVQGAEVINNTSHRNGGGLTISQDSEVIITGGRISGNKCAGGAGYGYGGGIYATGTSAYGASRVTIQNGEISNNIASNNGGGVYAGGDSDTDPDVCTTVLIQGGTISGNQAQGTSGSDYGYGGGILAGRASRVNVEGGSITGNSAIRYGGGLACNVQTIVNVDGGNILNNTAGNGAGIWLGDSARINVKNGMIKGNTAEAYWNAAGTKVSGGNGGAILASASSRIFVTGGQITENYAIGSAYYSTGEEGSEHRQTSTGSYTERKYQGGNGGGIYAQNNAQVMVQQLSETGTSGKITKNNASNNGGGIYVSGYYTDKKNYGRAEVTVEGGEISENIAGSYGGGIYTTGVNTKGAASCGLVTISGGIINKNQAKENDGGGIAANVNSTVTVTGGSITENLAKSGGGVCAISASTVTLNGGSVTKNQATNYGGGIYARGHYTDEKNYGRATVTVQSGEISENIAGIYGGGIYTTGSSVMGADSCALVTISGGTVSKNRATESGGGIHANLSSSVIVTGGVITGNTAKSGGGVCSVSAASVTLNGGSVTENGATENGGGVCAKDRSAVLIKDGQISANTAGSYGGGIYATGQYTNATTYGHATVNVEGGTISGNIAGHSGGGIFADGADVNRADTSAAITISGGTISGNQASTNGGGVGADQYSAVLIKGGEITGNTCSDNGAGIYAVGSATVTMQQSDDGQTFGSVTCNTGAVRGGGIYAGVSATVTLKKGNIQYNTATHGGGIFASGGKTTGSTVDVEGGEISHNTALLGNGGGLYVVSGANVTISEGKINENTARHTDDEQNDVEDAGRGGGIYATSHMESGVFYGAGHVTVTGGEIRKNTAQANGGAIYATSCGEDNESYAASITVSGGSLYENTAQYGGAIYAVRCADINVDDGAIYSNTAVQGGGIYAGTNSDVSITGGQIYSNSVSDNGGGIYATHSADVTVSDGEIYGNTARNGGGICANTNSNISITGGTIGGVLDGGTTVGNIATDKGGGIYATDSANVTVSNGEIAANTALNGGGICAGVKSNVSITGGQIYSNSAGNNGGGIYASSTDATDENIASSVTVSGGKLYGNTAVENGGGIYATYCADVTVSDGEIYGNTAKNGGGICANTNSDISITGGTIGGILEDGTTVGNTATVNGGGIYAAGGAQVSMMPMEGDDTAIGSIIGNKAAVNGGGVYATTAAQVTLRKGDIKTNSAQYGGGIYADGSNGATQVSQCATVLLDGGTVTENTSENGAGIYATRFSTVIIENGLIDNNTATANGGGIYAASSATVTMRPKAGSGEDSGGVISNNSAYRGAGVYLTNTAKVTVSGGTIKYNTAKVGGGIYAGSTSNVTVENGKIDSNTAVQDANATSTGFGGGIYTAGSASLEISGGDIIRNTAASRGGGIHGQGYSRITVKGGEVSDNKSKTSGGGISLTNDATITVQGGKICGNTANQDGGGLYIITAATATVEGGEISGNRATGNGGGIYVGSTSGAAKVFIRKGTNEQGKVTVGTVTDNLADNGGGVFVLRGGTLIVNEGHIINNTAAAPKTADLPGTGRKLKSTALHGAGGGICVVGENLKDGQGNQIIATFKLEGTLVNGKLNMAIYGNESTFSGDEVFSNGNYTSLDIPLVSQMNLDGYELDIVGWYEDYNTGDTQYASGLNRKGLTSSSVDRAQVKRYRNSTVTERQIIADDYVNGSNLADGIQYVNLPNAYVAMALGIPNASNDTVVVDFGMSVDIDLLSNDTLFNLDNPEGKSMLGTSLPDVVAADKEILYSKVGLAGFNISDYFLRDRTAEDASTCIDLPMGKANWIQEEGKETGSLHYVLKNRQLDREEVFYYVVPGTNYYYYAAVTVVPATSIYYEDNSGLVTYHTTSQVEQLAKWEVVPENAQSGDPVQDQDRPGASILKDLDADNIYGYDSSYANCTTYSGGAAHWVTVTRDRNDPLKTTAARATFTFTGTGFDIVSLCSASTGILMVNVYEGADINFDAPDFDRYVTTYMVDTHYGYAYNEKTGKWELNQASATTLYQVPVIKADLTKVLTYGDDPATQEEDPGYYYKDYGYGTYSVEIYVANSFLEREPGYWSADFYLDAIRIYNPAGYNGGSNTNIRDAYLDDQEGWPTYQELRNLFIEQTELKDDEKVKGIIFIDGSDDPTIQQYKTWGPNNEIYLATGQTIAFRLDADSYTDQVASVQIGMRGATGWGDVLVQYQGDNDDEPQTILDTQNGETGQLSATDLYYDISAAMGKVLTVKNTGTTPISLSNIKVTHSSDPATRLTGSGELGGYFSMSRHDAQIALNILTAQKLAEPTVTPKYPALSYNGMICYNVFFSAEDLGDLTADDLGLAVFDSYDPEGTVETAKDVIMGATEIDGLYMVATNGVNAKYLGDTQYFRAFAKKADGSCVYSKMVSYSALDYATNVLAKSDDVKLKQLAVAMLNYGAEAQKFFGYKTDDLMNKDLSADHQALLTGFDASSLNSVGKVDAAKVGAFASTGGFTRRSPAISFKGAFEINYFFTPANAVDGDMTLYFWGEDTYNSVSRLTAENADKAVVMTLENGSYTAASDEIAAKYLDKTLYVAAVYQSGGETYCSGVLPYSIAAYCQKPPAEVQALATAAAIYGCTAKQYFG